MEQMTTKPFKIGKKTVCGSLQKTGFDNVEISPVHGVTKL